MSDCSRTVDDVKTFIQTWKGLDSQQMMKFYDRWAETYNQDAKMIDYRAPHVVVEFLNDSFSGNREEVQVLDVACGSGLVAKLMAEMGFKHFVGVDGNKAMLELAAKTGLYQDLKQALLGTEPLPAQTGTFDVVIIVGALREGHVPVSILRELCDAAKPGGYICMSRAESKTERGKEYKVSMEKEVQLMEKEGLWTHAMTKEMYKYMRDFESDEYLRGTMHLYKKSLV